MMRNPITKMGVVVYSFLSVLSAHADSSAVAYAKTITERLGHESFNDLQSGTSKVETIQGTFPISLFFAGRWSFTITPETGAFMIDDSSFTDRAKFLDKRPTGYSEEELLKRVEEMFSRLRWRRDIDYSFTQVHDAGDPGVGKIAECQRGLQVASIVMPAVEGWGGEVTLGSVHQHISSGRLIHLSLTSLNLRKTEELSQVIPRETAAAKAREVVVQYLRKVDPDAIAQLPSVAQIAASGGRSLTTAWESDDSRFELESFPSTVKALRVPVYHFSIGPARVSVHATSGRVVRAHLKSDEARATPPLPPRRATQADMTTPEVPKPVSPPIALWTGMGLGGLVLGAAYLMTRKRG